mmetsp:Transcript_3331/g.10200  ORF Transcript_3331/g.10200 Transcript_3331/m.10200 type:complete len:239 (+) Transcript_3331:820-1536(+)
MASHLARPASRSKPSSVCPSARGRAVRTALLADGSSTDHGSCTPDGCAEKTPSPSPSSLRTARVQPQASSPPPPRASPHRACPSTDCRLCASSNATTARTGAASTRCEALMCPSGPHRHAPNPSPENISHIPPRPRLPASHRSRRCSSRRCTRHPVCRRQSARHPTKTSPARPLSISAPHPIATAHTTTAASRRHPPQSRCPLLLEATLRRPPPRPPLDAGRRARHIFQHICPRAHRP